MYFRITHVSWQKFWYLEFHCRHTELLGPFRFKCPLFNPLCSVPGSPNAEEPWREQVESTCSSRPVWKSTSGICSTDGPIRARIPDSSPWVSSRISWKPKTLFFLNLWRKYIDIWKFRLTCFLKAKKKKKKPIRRHLTKHIA